MNSSRRRTLSLCIALPICFVSGANAGTYAIPDGDVAALVNAMNSANTAPGPDTIELAVDGRYVFTKDLVPGGILVATPEVRSEIVINGNGSTLQRYANAPLFRFFFIANPGALTLRNLSLRGGEASQCGGAIRLDAGALTLDASYVADNRISSGGGGAICNQGGNLTIINSTIHNNTDLGEGGGAVRHVLRSGPASTTIVNSSLFENRAAGVGPGRGRGDAVFVSSVNGASGTVVIKNTILGSPTAGLGSDCAVTGGALTSAGHNIASDASCAFGGTGDVNGASPKLGALAHLSGSAPAFMPDLASPTVNAIALADCTNQFGVALTKDQQGRSRPAGPACDIGPVEVAGYDVEMTAGVTSNVWSIFTPGTNNLTFAVKSAPGARVPPQGTKLRMFADLPKEVRVVGTDAASVSSVLSGTVNSGRVDWTCTAFQIDASNPDREADIECEGMARANWTTTSTLRFDAEAIGAGWSFEKNPLGQWAGFEIAGAVFLEGGEMDLDQSNNGGVKELRVRGNNVAMQAQDQPGKWSRGSTYYVELDARNQGMPIPPGQATMRLTAPAGFIVRDIVPDAVRQNVGAPGDKIWTCGHGGLEATPDAGAAPLATAGEVICKNTLKELGVPAPDYVVRVFVEPTSAYVSGTWEYSPSIEITTVPPDAYPADNVKTLTAQIINP